MCEYMLQSDAPLTLKTVMYIFYKQYSFMNHSTIIEVEINLL